MGEADGSVIEALLDDVLDASMIRDAVDEALELLQGHAGVDRAEVLDAELAAVSAECGRLSGAIAAGGQLSALLEALSAHEVRRAALTAERDAARAQRRLKASEAGRVRTELLELTLLGWLLGLDSNPRFGLESEKEADRPDE